MTAHCQCPATHDRYALMKLTTERSPRKAKGQGPERREEILAAALRLFNEFGVYAVSTRQIAVAVGISQPTLYAYFPTKDQIGSELQNRAFGLLADALTAGAKGDVRSLEDLVAMLRIYVDFGLTNPDMYRIAFMWQAAPGGAGRPEPDQALSPAAQSTYGVLRREITDLHERGLTLGLDPETLTQSVWAAMHGLIALVIVKPGFPWVEREHLITSHLTLIARGLLARAAASAFPGTASSR